MKCDNVDKQEDPPKNYRLRFSPSKIDCYTTCPKRYFYRYIKRIVPKQKAKPLSAGSCISSFLEHYRKKNTLEKCLEILINVAKKDNALLWKKIDDPQRSVERLMEIMIAYTEEYPNEPLGTIQSEITFEYPLKLEDFSDEIIFNGIIDGIISNNGVVSIIEDKTTSRLGPTFFTEKKDSFQILWYMFVAREMGLFNIGSKNHTPKCTINAIYIHKENLRFERDITVKTFETLKRSYRFMKQWITTILKAEEKNDFPRDFNFCHTYSGCEYLSLRDLNKDSRMYERILNTMYTQKKER